MMVNAAKDRFCRMGLWLRWGHVGETSLVSNGNDHGSEGRGLIDICEF